MIEDPELHKLFKAESEEHLSRLDDGLLRLEKTPADSALLEEVFRESHSLKGAARMLGLSQIEAVAHGLESILNAARKGEAPLTAEAIEHMNAALSDLRQQVQAALADRMRTTYGGVYQQSRHHLHLSLPIPLPPRRTLLRRRLLPALAPPKLAATPAVVSTPFRIETVRVETRKLDDLLTQVGELSVIQGRAQHRLALTEAMVEQWAVLDRARRNHAGLSARHVADSEAAVRFGVLLKEVRNALFDDNARLESTVKLLEDQVRSIRLLPLSTVFTLFTRMVRDLAREQGKEAELALEGGDITVDKRILEEMKDPLMHLIRNAIDHGIEQPDERERLGKPRGGTVRLRAVRENANVLLEVQDDGRGLESAAIRQEAKKRGLHDESSLADMTTAQLQQLIFTPGFTTSNFVTELSGRGVGLDVVRVNVERMKGSIHLESAAGHGVTIQLRLPLSLATTRLLLANECGRLYGLPVEFVLTSRRVREEDLFTLEGRPTFMLDGQPVIAVRLASLLELPEGERSTAAGKALACIVLQVGDERLGLLTDDLIAEEEVVPKPLGPPLRRVRNVSALAMLGSGEICAVLNPADLLRTSRMRNAELGMHPRGVGRAVPVAEATTATHRNADAIPNSAISNPHSKPAILLVEDSVLIRAMEKRILGDGGYEVVTAVDGVDALNVIGSRAFAAVVSDIMMPNMDGLTLTARIRAEPRYKELPVILVTTLASDEDKRRGLDAGANAYIPKPSFDQRVLLDTLKRMIVT